LIKSDRIEWLL